MAHNLSELPDELQQEEQLTPEEAAANYKRLQQIGQLVASKREDCVKARKESGIEDIWTYCEEAYAAIDDMNRVAGGAQQWRKPTSPTGPLTRETKEEGNRSTVFIRLTTRYVDMGAAKVKEKALPVGDKPFDMIPSPKPDLVQPVGPPPTPAAPPAMQQGGVGTQPVPNPGTAQPAVPTPAAAAASEAAATISKAKASAKKAADRIYDWLSEAKYPTHIRRVIDDGARIGVGVLKGPFPDSQSERAFTIEGDIGVLEYLEKTSLGVTSIDPWNFFPARNCGEDIQTGDGCAERSYMSEAKLLGLKKLREPGGLPIYLGEQIDKVIEEGPDKSNLDDSGQRKTNPEKKGLFTVWHYYGQLSRADMITLGAVGAKELPDDVVHCHAIVTLVNDTVIRAQFNPLEKSGHYPFRVFSWSRRAGFWAGVGVGEQVAVPQKMVNAGTRAWLNNAGVSSGVQLVLDESKLYPIDGSLVVGGGVKLWGTTESGAGEDVRKLMAAVEIPNLGQELKAIIDYAFRLAEEMSNIPLISQGQTGPTDPQTFGQAELQNNNGNTLLRQVADSLDGQVIEPLIDDYYDCLLLDPDVPIEEKGDFKIIAKGCSAMVEKAIQEQTLMGMLGMSMNPIWGQDPKKMFAKVMQAKRLDPEETAYTPEELAAIQSQPQPKAPAVEVAQIRRQTDLERQQMADKTRIDVANLDRDRDTAYNDSLARRDEIALQGQREELALRERLAMLEYANKRSITLDQVKADLASVAIKANLQRELSHDAMAVDLHKHHKPGPQSAPQVLTPPTEPAGRAPDGQAYQA